MMDDSNVTKLIEDINHAYIGEHVENEKYQMKVQETKLYKAILYTDKESKKWLNGYLILHLHWRKQE